MENSHLKAKTIPGQKTGNSTIFYSEDGWYYHKKHKNVGNLTYYCVEKTSLKCTGKATSNLDYTNFRKVEGHSGHEKALHYHETVRLEEEITAKCLADQSLDVSEVIEATTRS